MFSGTKGYRTKPPVGVRLNPLHPLSRGLVGYWLFNEGSGSMVHDISRYGNHGMLVGMSVNTQTSGWGGSKFGGGLSFDGSDDYANCGNIFQDFRNDRTIIARIKLDNIAADHAVCGKWDGTYEKDAWFFSFDDVGGLSANTDKIVYVIPTGAGSAAWLWIESSLSLQTDIWYHIAVVHRWGTDAKIYIDGEDDTGWSQNVTATTATGSSSNFILGSLPNGSKDFAGDFDYIQIYNRALSAAEIKLHCDDPFCNLLRVPVRYAPAVPGGLPIPVAMNYYRRRRIA